MKFKNQMLVLILTVVSFLLGSGLGQCKELVHVKYGAGIKVLGPTAMYIAVGKELGYYDKEGVDYEVIPLGDSSLLLSSANSGVVDMAIGIPVQMLRAASTGELKVKAFYTYLQGCKYEWMVTHDSPIKDFKDLKGKTLGVFSFGSGPLTFAKANLRLSGIDPEKDVKWAAVGQGASAAVALNKKRIDAYMTWDVQGGSLDILGYDYKHFLYPPFHGMEGVGRLYYVAREDYMNKNPDVIVGLSRASAKGALFSVTNPDAAIRIFYKWYPESIPEGKSIEKVIQELQRALKRRLENYQPVHYNKLWGWISEQALRNEAAFYQIKVWDYSQLYTNKFIDRINDFDREEVIREAKSYKFR